MQQYHLEKKTIDNRILNELNKRTRSKTAKLSHSGKLAYANNDYCEITRNYSSFYWMNILGIVFLLPMIILGLGSTLFLLYDSIFNLERYAATWHDNPGAELLLHIAFFAILFITFIFATFVNYFIFAPSHYPVRFNRKTGKIYVYDYVLYSINYKLTNTFWWHHPFYKQTKAECKEYEWSQIQGITIYSRNNNSSTATVRCVVYESRVNTNKIDSFNLISTETATDVISMQNYKLWLWINNYMNFKDELLDMSINTRIGIYGREVTWPDHMDKRSKAPSLDKYRETSPE